MTKAIPPVEARELEQQQFWQGQMLRSRDFRDQVANSAQHRWWHNRAMHRAFGIASGFKVEPGEQGVLIHPGRAYDCFGRELALCDDQWVPLDESESTMTLYARYKAASIPEFHWKPSSRYEPHNGVPIARVRRIGKEVEYDASFVLPFSVPLAKPRIASGTTIAGATQWEAWNIELNGVNFPIGFRVSIDTSAAGFTEVPCYFAWLQGSFLENEAPPVAFTFINEATLTSFSFKQFVASQGDRGREGRPQKPAIKFLAAARRQKLFVSWLAIQPTPTN